MNSCHLRRFLSTVVSKNQKKHIAVVGSGPAGFYLTQQLLKQRELNLQVDIYEKLPVPFGLVRYGVAPDHPDVKNVEGTFTKVASDDHVRFVGNVSLGSDISTQELRNAYDAVVLAYGAAKDRSLGIPGEDSYNLISARNFVGYYNGLPEDRHLDFSLDTDHAVIIGLGNVAIDVARVLTTPIDDLRGTDITEAAMEKLSKSRIEKVSIVGRRGPLQVAFTIKELREMLHIRDCKPCFDLTNFAGMNTKEIVKSLQRPRKRLTELLFKTVMEPPTKKQVDLWGDKPSKEWHLKLLRTPLEIHSDAENRVSGITLGINKLVGEEFTEDQKVEVDPGRIEKIDCGLIFRSIGYFGVPVENGIPYDQKKGIVPNVDGFVEPGLYCAGWLATGPRGVIVDTMTEAFKVGQTIGNDLQKNLTSNDSVTAEDKKGFAQINPILQERKIRPVSFEDWKKIDQKEKEIGETSGKPREKFTNVSEMMSQLE